MSLVLQESIEAEATVATTRADDPTNRGADAAGDLVTPPESQRATEEQLEVVHHEEDRFYELRVDGAFGGLLVYGKSENRLVLTHTFIAEGFRGRGLSKFMIRGALDDIRVHGRTLTNYCPVIDGFIERHPEYISLIDEHNPGNWSRRDHQSRLDGALRL
jgi:predicted GNAT family acetyltransferase